MIALRLLRSAAGLVGGFALSLVAAGDEIAAPTFTRNAVVHDPSIVRAGTTFYVFGSHLASASTTDLMNWTQISTGPEAGNALVPNPQVEFREALTWASATTFWAPDVIRLADGRYRFYYDACKGDSPRSALGVAVADSITGPYTNVGLMLKSGMWGEVSPDGRVYDATIHPNVVDPAVFFDHVGRLWMVYGSYSGGIFILELDPSTGFPLAGQGYGKKLIGGNHARIEGAYILYSPESEYYYLFLSFGGLAAADGYNIRLGRSRNPDGPFLDAAGHDLTNVAGAPGTLFDDASIAPHGVKLMGGYQFLHAAGEAQSTSRGYLSPGHNSAYYDPDTEKYFLVFHTRFVGRGEAHEVRVHQLFLNEDDWLVVAPHRYAHETIAATDPGQIPGDYKLINHGKAISGTATPSSIVTLRADHSISGSLSGTWQASGEHSATLTLSGTTYRGVFIRQWDDDNQLWILAFSALSADGVAVWGSRVGVPAPLAITTQPASQTITTGQPVTFSVSTTGTPAPTYQWRKDGVDLAGATGSTLTISRASAGDMGNFSVVVRNSLGTVTSTSASLVVVGRPEQLAIANGDRSARIYNLSTRGIVAPGEDSLIAGFVLVGPGLKRLLLLVSGLTLHRLGVEGEIGRPHLKVMHHVGGAATAVAENSDWQADADRISTLIQQVGAQPLTVSADPAHGDAGVVLTLAAGVYSVVVDPAAGSANRDGVGLIELYDTEPTGGSRLANISSRGRIESGARQMFVGVVVTNGAARLLIRGVGPTLGALGVGAFLPNPLETLYRNVGGAQQAIMSNDDGWNSAQADQITVLAGQYGATAVPDGSRDAALLLRADPGVYSAVITSVDGRTGVAMAEIYDVTDRPAAP